jgi:alkylated DNA repair dioxygenase AlkB
MQTSTQHRSSVGTSISESGDVTDLVNLAFYPVSDSGAPSAEHVIANGRAQLARDGLCLFPDFLAPHALKAMADEARAMHSSAYHAEQAQTDDGSGRLKGFTLPRLSRNASSAVAYDLLAASSPIRRLYEWEGLVGFVRDLLDVEHLYRCADPIISCLLMYYDEGDELGWHFDPNDGVVTLLLQAPEEEASLSSFQIFGATMPRDGLPSQASWMAPAMAS